jgi:glycosyltransferase involved in cell wall biosynthesis
MKVSVAIAAHNEGDFLWRTVQSCYESSEGVDLEIVVVDDASGDDGVAELRRRFPEVKVIRHATRQGVAIAKDAAARAGTGDVILFLDGHCKPEPGAIRRLVEDIDLVGGKAVVAPRVPVLLTEVWRCSRRLVGFGFAFELQAFDCWWLTKEDLKPNGRFHESPAFVGCIAAMSRRLYEDLWGFDRDMLQWGVEDLDFSLKAWLMGHAVLHDFEAVIGHRFRGDFDNYTVADESVALNKIRMARKNFQDDVFESWVEGFRPREAPETWAKAWELFESTRESAERERRYLFERRSRDEHWYAERFGLKWPRRGGSRDGER